MYKKVKAGGEGVMFCYMKINSYLRLMEKLFFLHDVSHESLVGAIRKAQMQTIQIFMNINRIINKYIISKYVKRENKPG